MTTYAQRLEFGLVKCARRYAPRLAPPEWRQPGDYRAPLPELAHQLAGYGVLVMVGNVAPGLQTQAAIHFRDWVENYKSLYSLLASALFPTFKNVQAFYVDEFGVPPIVGLQGDAIPVIEMLAGYIAPYSAAKQGNASEVELIGLLDIVMEELEAGDLPRDTYRTIRDNCAALVRTLLTGYIKQVPLTPMLRPLFSDTSQPMPPEVPERLDVTQVAPSANTQTISPPPPVIQPPTMLPEEDRIDLAPPPTQVPEAPLFKPDSIPVFFDPGRRDKRQPPPPPVPRLPEE